VVMNKTISRLLIVDSFIMTAFGLLGPIYAIFVEKIGGNILDTGIAFAIYSITLGVFSYFIGKLGDRIKKDYHLLCIGLVITTAGFCGYLLVQNPMELMIVQFILGIGHAVYNPIFDSVFSAHLDTNKKSSEWADWESLNFIVTGVMSVLGAWLVFTFGFKTLFILMFLSSLFGLVLLKKLKRQIMKNV